MTFTEIEIDYLRTQDLGRLATVQPDGTPQVSPVGFRYDEEHDAIDVGGFRMSGTQKFRNVQHDSRVALVVDDLASKQPWRVRCLEIRGFAEAIVDEQAVEGSDGSLIRIHPRRVISFGIGQTDVEPHLLRPDIRNVAPS
jgi:pyridoxamine 5'-phosphate oxidase family protein